jgi:hypothetical protein
MHLATAGAPPFDGQWTGYRPDPAWTAPVMPADWDLPHRGDP